MIRDNLENKIRQKVRSAKPKPENEDEVVEYVMSSVSIGDILLELAVKTRDRPDTDPNTGYFLKTHIAFSFCSYKGINKFKYSYKTF